MSMDVPVVSSDLGGLGEIVVDGETGYKVELGNSQVLAEAITKLWEDQAAYQRMRTNVRQFMVENLNKEKQFDPFLEYFRTVIRDEGIRNRVTRNKALSKGLGVQNIKGIN